MLRLNKPLRADCGYGDGDGYGDDDGSGYSDGSGDG